MNIHIVPQNHYCSVMVFLVLFFKCSPPCYWAKFMSCLTSLNYLHVSTIKPKLAWYLLPCGRKKVSEVQAPQKHISIDHYQIGTLFKNKIKILTQQPSASETTHRCGHNCRERSKRSQKIIIPWAVSKCLSSTLYCLLLFASCGELLLHAILQGRAYT